MINQQYNIGAAIGEFGGRDEQETNGEIVEVDRGRRKRKITDAVQQQLPSAWERLTELYCPLVYSWGRRAGLRTEDAADSTQEVFRAVVTNRSGFRHERPDDTFRGWLWTITQHKIIDLRRRQDGRPEAVGGTDALQRLLQVPDAQVCSSGDSSPALLGPLLAHALELIRSEFEERSWRAFWEVVVEGHAPAEVAGLLVMSVNAVYVARSRILRRLREEIGEAPP